MKRILFFSSLVLALTLNALCLTQDISSQSWQLWLDEKANYWEDELFLSPENIAQLPVNPPTCGWESLYSLGKQVTLPATVEEHFWGENGNRFGTAGDYAGVSWFSTKINVPADWKGKRVVLHFESVRLRAEVFVNEKLVGYDLMNGTPFAVDISSAVKYGADNNLAVRITDPDGNFLWIDFVNYSWNKYKIPPSHAFGGITGIVELEVTDKVYIDDVFVKNQSDITSIDAEISIKNRTNAYISGDVELKVTPWQKPDEVVYAQSIPVSDITNSQVINQKISIPGAKPWSPDSPSLYVLTVIWSGKDGSKHTITKRFGFRWFEPKTVDGQRMFFLNGKRIVLRTSISWGFWPVNGIYPTPELARKQIQTAKDLGLNMLNFHRGIGQPLLLDLADEMGLLYYQEPGGYKTGKFGDFTAEWNRERFIRMMRRDRSHPSLIIYNMINEANEDPRPHEYEDIKLFHSVDPTRVITFTSTNLFRKGTYGGVNPANVEAGIKLHMLPYDTTRHLIGWWDQHFPDGPGVYLDNFYNSPTDMHKGTDNLTETVMWGEDGAIGTPARLELIKKDVDAGNLKGWDSDSYLAQYEAYDKFLDDKEFRNAFPTVDALCQSLGANAMYYQGRIIENIRVNNHVDCYVVNGWEGEKIENHSGVVDIYRNPKADPAIMAHYNQPLFVAIKARNLVFEVGAPSVVDFYIVNENNLKGSYKLKVTAADGSGVVFEKIYKVKLQGGNVYGQLLVESVNITPAQAGYTNITAELLKGSSVVANGHEKLYTVAIDKTLQFGSIAVVDSTDVTKNMLSKIGITEFSNTNGNVTTEDILIINQASGPFSRTGMHKRHETLEWVKRGHTMLVLGEADKMADWLADKEIVDYRGRRDIGTNWYGGNYVVKDHRMFEGLPVNTAFNWEYQCLADYKKNRYGLRVENGETVVAVTADHKPEIYASVVIVPLGRGKIILSTLDLQGALKGNNEASVVAAKILQNFLAEAAKPVTFN